MKAGVLPVLDSSIELSSIGASTGGISLCESGSFAYSGSGVFRLLEWPRRKPHGQRHLPVDGIENSAVRPQVSAVTMEESIVMQNANDSREYTQTAAMAINGLVRPFRTNPTAPIAPDGDYPMPPGVTSLLPAYVNPTVLGKTPNRIQLDPWRSANDVDSFTWGEDYSGFNAYQNDGDGANARVLGLRGPAVLVGWGFDTETKCVPGSQHAGADWDDDVLMR